MCKNSITIQNEVLDLVITCNKKMDTHTLIFYLVIPFVKGFKRTKGDRKSIDSCHMYFEIFGKPSFYLMKILFVLEYHFLFKSSTSFIH